MRINASALYNGNIFHTRSTPVENNFKYPMFMFAIDLDNLHELKRLKFLGINEPSIFCFRDEDHLKFWERDEKFLKLKKGTSSISARIKEYLSPLFPELTVSRIVLLTNLRILGYVFNPVSFYYIYEQVGDKENLKMVLAEVNNTFGEQRLFIVESIEKVSEYRKNFYVSPFISHDSDFHFYLNTLNEKLFIRIDSIYENKPVLKAVLTGEREEISNYALFLYLMKFPLYSIFIVVRIHWQALKLYLKKVPYFGKAETDKQIYELGEYHGKNS